MRTFLREHVAGFEKMALSDAEIIRDFILPARRFVADGGPKGGNVATPAFSRTEAVADENGNPTFSGNGITIDFAQPTERFEIIPAEGQSVVSYAIMAEGGFDYLGYVELLLEGGKPVSLLDIEVNDAGRKRGTGRKAIELILAANPTADLNVSNIAPEARGFWSKMGVPEQNADGAYDGTLNWSTYLEAQTTDTRRALEARFGSSQARGNGNAGTEGGSEGPAFSRTISERLTQGLNSVRDAKLPAGYVVGDLFNSDGRINRRPRPRSVAPVESQPLSPRFRARAEQVPGSET